MAGGQAFPFACPGPRCGARSVAAGAESRHGAQERASSGRRHERMRPSRWSMGRAGCGRRLPSPERRPARPHRTLSRHVSAYLGISRKKLPVQSETAPRRERMVATALRRTPVNWMPGTSPGMTREVVGLGRQYRQPKVFELQKENTRVSFGLAAMPGRWLGLTCSSRRKSPRWSWSP